MRKPFVIFLILAVYILLQFAWWAYLIHDQGQLLNQVASGKPLPLEQRDYLRMILSEGTVFLIIVGALLFMAYRTYKKELSLVRAKDNFLMAVTHELRTPIAGMRLNMQTLQRTDLNENQRNKLLTNAISDTERLKDLSDRVLLAAKKEEEVIALNPTQSDISALTLALFDKCKDEYRSHHLSAEIAGEISARIDELAYSSIVLNLVQNAVKYSPKESTISIRLQKRSDAFVLEIEDQGSGISEEEKKKVFRKFHRTGNESTRNTKGTGLGLFIVKRFVDGLKGEISIADSKPQGSIFIVTLPY